jgi:hypothetical protein
MEQNQERENVILPAMYGLLGLDIEVDVRLETEDIEDIVLCLQHFGGTATLNKLRLPEQPVKYEIEWLLTATHADNGKSLSLRLSKEITENAYNAQKVVFSGKKSAAFDRQLAYAIFDNAFFVPSQTPFEDEED